MGGADSKQWLTGLFDIKNGRKKGYPLTKIATIVIGGQANFRPQSGRVDGWLGCVDRGYFLAKSFGFPTADVLRIIKNHRVWNGSLANYFCIRILHD